MGKKSGKACKAVEPVIPDVAEEADLADPGEMADIIKEQLEKKTGKYGSEKVTPFKPDEDLDFNLKKGTNWIEIELVDEEDNPVPGMKYKITFSDDTVAEGTLDGNGFARLERIPKGDCMVTFPELDKEAWEKI